MIQSRDFGFEPNYGNLVIKIFFHLGAFSFQYITQYCRLFLLFSSLFPIYHSNYVLSSVF